MKTKELRQMGTAELQAKEKELRKDLVKSNAQVALGSQIKNPGQIRQTKKTIAKVLTILKEKNNKPVVKESK